MDIVLIDPLKLIPYERNNKVHSDAQVENVMESIKKYGFVQPVVIDKDNVVVIGHCRTEASKRLGLKEIPCVRVDGLSEEQVNALRIVDNKTNESEWDFDNLKDELSSVDLEDFDFEFEMPKSKTDKVADLLKAFDTSVAEMTAPKSKDDEAEYSKDYCGIIIGGQKLNLSDSDKQHLITLLGKFISSYGTSDGFMRWLIDNAE